MALEKHKIVIWRGKRSTYNALPQKDYWTRYSVKEPDGTWTEYYGQYLITKTAGEILPVIDILDNAPESPVVNGRYLVKDGDGYSLYVYGDDVSDISIEPFGSDKYCVRVINKGMKAYVITDGVLKTYDDVDCGTF